MPSQQMEEIYPEVYISSLVLQNVALIITTYLLYALLKNIKGKAPENASFYEMFALSKHKLLRFSTLILIWMFELLYIVGVALNRVTNLEIDTPGTAFALTFFLLHALTYLETFERIYFALPGNSKLKIFRIALCCLAVITFTVTRVSKFIYGNLALILNFIGVLLIASHFLTCILVELATSVFMIRIALKNKGISSFASLNNSAKNDRRNKATEKDTLKQKLKVKLYMSYGLFAASDVIIVAVFILYGLGAITAVKSPFTMLYLAICNCWVPCHIHFSFKLLDYLIIEYKEIESGKSKKRVVQDVVPNSSMDSASGINVT